MPKLYDLRDDIMLLSDTDRANLLALIEREEAARPFKASRADLDLWAVLVKLSPHSMHRSLDAFLRDKQHGMTRAAWSSAVGYLDDFVADVKPVRHPDDDRAALTALTLRCLASDMQLRNVEVTPKKILDNLQRLYTAVDAAFPGYIEAGLLHELIRLSPDHTPVAAE
jgi:hypothetical protein